MIDSEFLFHFPLLDATVNKELFCPFTTTSHRFPLKFLTFLYGLGGLGYVCLGEW